MAITYSVSTNTITVTAYTESVPCNFADLYNADKAGTLSLHARTGITGTDGSGVAVDRAERPADYIILGGTSNDLYITISNWNGTTATIRITGTDRDGTAQTEDIVVTGNGTNYTTKWFKTITHTQVTVFTATTFDYDLVQGQWGAIERSCTTQYCFDCKIVIGNGSTVTWFADNNKQIIFRDGLISANYQVLIDCLTNANLILGQLVNISEKITTRGCIFNFFESTYRPGLIRSPVGTPSDGTIYLYSCIFTIEEDNSSYIVEPNRMWNCSIMSSPDVGSGGLGIELITSDGDIYYLVNHNFSVVGIRIRSSSGTYLDLRLVTDGRPGGSDGYGLYYDFANGTVKNVELVGTITYDVLLYSVPAGNSYAINCTFPSPNWTFRWVSSLSSTLYRQYEFDLKVIDKDNTPINSATVKIWDKNSNLVVDTTTNASGVISTQTITRGHYTQATGNTLQEASPHLIKIEKSGYTTYEADFTLEEKTDWLVALQVGGGLLHNPPMTGGMV